MTNLVLAAHGYGMSHAGSACLLHRPSPPPSAPTTPFTQPSAAAAPSLYGGVPYSVLCYTEKVTKAWHRQGTQQNKVILDSIQTTVNRHNLHGGARHQEKLDDRQGRTAYRWGGAGGEEGRVR